MSAYPPPPARFPPDYPASLATTPINPYIHGPVGARTYPALHKYSQPPCPCKCQTQFSRFSKYVFEARHTKNGYNGFLGDKCWLKKTYTWSGTINHYVYDGDGQLEHRTQYTGTYTFTEQFDVYGNYSHYTTSTITFNRWHYNTQTHFNQPYGAPPYPANLLISETNTLRTKQTDCPTSAPPADPYAVHWWGSATSTEELTDEYTDAMLMDVLEQIYALLPTPPPVPTYHPGFHIIARIHPTWPNSSSNIPLINSLIATATADVTTQTATHTTALNDYDSNPTNATWHNVVDTANALQAAQENLNILNDTLAFHTWWQANLETSNPLIAGNRVYFFYDTIWPEHYDSAQAERIIVHGFYPSATWGRLSRVAYRCVLLGQWRAWSTATRGTASATWQHSIATGPPFTVVTNSGPYTEQAPAELQPIGTEHTWIFLPQYPLPPPDSGHQHKRIVVAPPTDLPLQPTYLDLRGGWLYKTGFPQYDAPSFPPKIYAKEKFSGGFPGCPSLSLPAKNYTGSHSYNITNALYDHNLPADVAAAPGWRYTDLFNYRQFSHPGQILTPTKRQWLSQVQCTPSPAPPLNDLLIAELDDEFTTAQLTALVNTAADLNNSIFLSYPYDANSGPLTNGWGHYLSPDQRFYLRIHARVQFLFDLPLRNTFSYGLSPYYEHLLSSPAAPDFAGCTIAWDEVTRSWPSGTLSTVSDTRTINAWDDTQLTTPIVKEPTSGAFTAWITNARVLADPRLLQLPRASIVHSP